MLRPRWRSAASNLRACTCRLASRNCAYASIERVGGLAARFFQRLRIDTHPVHECFRDHLVDFLELGASTFSICDDPTIRSPASRSSTLTMIQPDAFSVILPSTVE